MRLLPSAVSCLLLAVGCSTPDPVQQIDFSQPLADLRGPRSGAIGLEYRLTMDDTGASLTPAERGVAAIGDDLALDLSATLRTLCPGCFYASAFGRSPGGNLWVDLTLRHPFRADFPHKQYEVFDVRAILLVPLGDAFFGNVPPGRNGGIGTDATIVRNADGYTPHFTERAPGPFRATIHPFKWFFTDDHPSPTVVGAPIPEHRMAYGATDTQRFELTIPPGGTLEWRVVLEAHYVEAADKLRPPDDPGGTRNPVYFLPEGHVDEAFRVDVAVEGMPKRAETRDITVTVTSSDWQQGATVDPLYPQLTNPDGLQATPSNIAGVGLEIPVFEFFSTEPTATVGAGTPANPRVDRWTLTTDPTTWGTFPFVVWVEDDRQPTDFTGLTSNADLRAFRIGFITIEP